jgi:hypothetical protein
MDAGGIIKEIRQCIKCYTEEVKDEKDKNFPEGRQVISINKTII